MSLSYEQEALPIRAPGEVGVVWSDKDTGSEYVNAVYIPKNTEKFLEILRLHEPSSPEGS